MDVKSISVYLDTSVLANWALLYKQPTEVKQLAEKRAKQCLMLLEQITQGMFSCNFETSTWAMAELAQVLKDSIIAGKILRDGQSLVFFNKLKRFYSLTKQEQEDLLFHIRKFELFLKSQNIALRKRGTDHLRVNELAFRYGLETSDATHVALASRNCQFLTTTDRDLIEAKPKILEIKVIRPSGLHIYKELRS